MRSFVTAAAILVAGAVNAASFNDVEITYQAWRSDFSTDINDLDDVKADPAGELTSLDGPTDGTPTFGAPATFTTDIPTQFGNIPVTTSVDGHMITFTSGGDAPNSIPTIAFFGFSIFDKNGALPKISGFTFLDDNDNTNDFAGLTPGNSFVSPDGEGVFINLSGVSATDAGDTFQVKISFVPLPAAAPMALAAFGALAFAAQRRSR